MKKLATLFTLILLLAACGPTVPEAAQTRMENGMKALATQDKGGFADHVLPAQREGALGVSDSYPVEAGMPASEMTLSDWLDVQFFSEISKAELTDSGDMEGENSATLIVNFDYPDGSFATRTFELKKEGDDWFIDFKATLELWKSINGQDALTALIME